MFEQNLEQFFYLAIGYLQMTALQIECYELDPNEWISQEEDDSSFNIRITATDFLMELIRGFKTSASNAFAAALGRRLSEAYQSLSQGDAYAWKLREACVYCVGSVANDMPNDLKSFDFAGKLI